MSNAPDFSPSLVPADTGPVYHAFGEEVQFHLTGSQTGGRLTLWTEIVPPGGGPPPHVHLNEDEWFVVKEGMFQFLVEGEWKEAPAGTTVFLPRKAIHTFKNTGKDTGKLLVATSPSGFETFFSRCAELFNPPNTPDMGRIAAIAAEHGIHFMD